jgi:hypothetical protein
MIQAKLENIFTLKEFNTEIRSQHEKAHGEGYCDIHDAIFKYMKDCDSYKEIGVNQGGTASAGILANPKKVELIDTNLSKYNQHLRPIAEGYCKLKNIDLKALEISSDDRKSVTGRYDVMLIDSYHKAWYLRKELSLHAEHINKYIILHDTNFHPNGLREMAMKFCSKNPWKVIEEGTTNVGYMVMERSE